MKFYAFLMLMKLGSKILYNSEKISPVNKINGLEVVDLKSTSGFDMRYSNESSLNETQLINFNKHLHIQNLLITLEDNHNNEQRKMNLLEENSFLFDECMGNNILAGGLMDDFNFEL